MKKYILFFVLALGITGISKAQVAIGTSTPDASAKFQIDATDKGFLAPRIALTSLTDNTTIASPATGLMVYCNGTGGLEEGFYYWNGSSWTKMSQVSNNQDLGYVVGWPSNANPPGYLLPLSGGTYNWADYPEFQTFNGTYASQFIASSTATTFTLKDINSTGRFLRGGSTAGTDQAGATKLPVVPFAVSTAGAHTHSVDPASVNTNTTGGHNHWVDPSAFTSSTNGNHTHGHNATGGQWNPGLAYNNGWNTTTGYDYTWGELNEVYTTALDIWWAGDHSHTIDVPGTTSSTNGDHAHSVDVAATTSTSNGDHTHTISGGDAETRPINTSIVWCIKVKPTAAAGNITINNVNGITTASNGLTASPSEVKLGGTLSENTTIAKGTNNLTFTGTGTLTNNGPFTNVGAITNTGVLTNSGSVGIGLTSPTTPLHVENAESFVTGVSSPSVNSVPTLYLHNTNNSNTGAHAISALRVMPGGGNPYQSWDIEGVAGYSMGLDNAGTDQLVIANNWRLDLATASSKMMIMNRTGQSRMIVPDQNGGYSSGWPAGWGGGINTYDLSCFGIYYNTLFAQSDKRLKNNVQNVDAAALNKYMQLRPVTYYWNQGKSEDKGLQYGFIAQEVEALFPEMVLTGSDEMQTKSMNYQALHSMTVKMVQSQQQTIERQQAQIDALMERLDRLEKGSKK
jgi:hypothetical protein